MMDSSAAATTMNPTVETMRRLAMHAASTAIDRIQHRYHNFAEYPYQERLHTTQENFMGIFPILKRIVYYLLVGSFLLAASSGTYGIFYIMVMPSNTATEKLYFDYSCRNPPINETVCTTGKGSPSSKQCQYSCSPTATVDIFAKHTPWEALHPDVIPEARSKTRILRPRKHYFLEVVLQLPETITNQQIGMFAVEVELRSSKTPLARSQRSARLPHESGWIGVVRKSLCLAPLLVGALTESRAAIVPSFRHFVESTKHPLQHVVVKLISQGSSWRGGDNVPVEVVAGELRIGKELNAFQSVLKEWFWTSVLFGTTTILLFYCLFYVVGSFIWESWAESRRQQRDDVMDLGEAPYFFDATPPQSTTAAHQENPFANEDGDDADQWEPMPAEQEEHDDVSVGTASAVDAPPDLRQEQNAAQTTANQRDP